MKKNDVLIKSKDAHKAILRSVLLLLEDLDTPVSLQCYDHLKNGDIKAYLEMSINPADYGPQQVDQYLCDSAAINVLKKYAFEHSPFDTQQNAVDTYLAAETQCKNTNENLVSMDESFYKDYGYSILANARRKIAYVLGRRPQVFDSDLHHFKPSKGSTIGCAGDYTSAIDKITSTIQCSPKAVKYVYAALATWPRLHATVLGIDYSGPFSPLAPLRIDLHNANRLSFVEKSAKTDRIICVEPTWNIILQGLLGRQIRARLKSKANIDIKNAQDLHRDRVIHGSIMGEISTIDLSSASDTISSELVYRLLPPEWFDVLDDLRSPYTEYPDGEVKLNNKFSSQGCGFTFELETLIFWAIAESVRAFRLSVPRITAYGDDIICGTDIFTEVSHALIACGFRINNTKSFNSGNFRESCGSDALFGNPVRSPYIKKYPVTYFDIYPILNTLRHFATRLSGTTDFCDSRVKRCWTSLLRFIPRKFQFFGPEYMEDLVILSSRYDVYLHRQHHIKCSNITTIEPVSRKRDLLRYPKSAQMCAALLGVTMRFPLRGDPVAYKLRSRDLLSTWCYYSYSFL